MLVVESVQFFFMLDTMLATCGISLDVSTLMDELYEDRLSNLFETSEVSLGLVTLVLISAERSSPVVLPYDPESFDFPSRKASIVGSSSSSNTETETFAVSSLAPS